MTDAIRKSARSNKWKTLCLSLKFRPKIMQLIIKMRQNIRRKKTEIKSLKHQLERNVASKLSENENKYVAIPIKTKEYIDSSTQTVENHKPKTTAPNSSFKNPSKDHKTDHKSEDQSNAWEQGDSAKSIADQVKEAALSAITEFENKAGWNVNDHGDNDKSIADQVKDVAQSAMQQSGMVFVESAGMYYDYKTGYYYNSELGLYYHTDTNCYYYYSDEKKQFVFHSYPDTSGVNENLLAHQKKKARKQLKRTQQERTQEDVENLTKTLSQDKEDTKAKRRKTKTKKDKPSEDSKNIENGEKVKKDIADIDGTDIKNDDSESDTKDIKVLDEENGQIAVELEDGECSDSSGGDEDDDSSSNASTATVEDEDSIAKHLPPCMRVIVKETDLPKLKVGTLYLITKDGGTIGREGEQHAIVIRDHNVSRNHLEVRYDMQRRTYVATDLGSKNGTILNGNRMSESTEVSMPMDILHGSTIQLGETKLLCHVHPGNDTCGHCEPGLVMETEEKEKKAAYTRTCSVKKQHEMELARLKNIYAPKLLEIEDKPYNDRAQARRETVGSSHHSAKTESASLETSISTENKGFKLLQKMGWSKGEGLGKESQGDTEPVPLVSNEGKAGLGTSGAVCAPPVNTKPRPRNTIATATMRLAARTKMLQPPAKAFQGDDDEEDLD